MDGWEGGGSSLYLGSLRFDLSSSSEGAAIHTSAHSIQNIDFSILEVHTGLSPWLRCCSNVRGEFESSEWRNNELALLLGEMEGYCFDALMSGVI